MRLIGLALTTLLLVAVALVIARSDRVGAAWGQLTGNDVIRFDQADIGDIAGRTDVGVPRIGAGSPLRDVRATSGRLAIHFASQVAAGTEGALA